MSGGHGKTSAVHFIEFDIDCFESRLVQNPINLSHCVVLEVFVTDGVKCDLLKHERKVALLENENPIRIKDSFYLSDKVDRLLKVVHH